MRIYDIAIIGAGASGMAAAITAFERDPSLRIVILECNDEPGRKISATGNGHCNLSNTACENYIGTLSFFERLGLITRIDEEGRIYPYSMEAEDVRRALVSGIERSNVEFEYSTRVTDIVAESTYEKTSLPGTCGDSSEGKKLAICSASTIENKKTDYEFKILTNRGEFKSRKILISTGGKAGAQFGSKGDGYIFARKLGHSVSRLAPALTSIETVEDTSSIAGVRFPALVKLFRSDNEIFREIGRLQFTDYGLSGICIMNMTSFMRFPDDRKTSDGMKDLSISVDIVPDFDDVYARIPDHIKNGFDALFSIAPHKLSTYISKLSCDKASSAAQMARDLRFTPKKLRGWQYAQVTSGGVSCDEFDSETMESKICRGLFFAGEVIDYDGSCGGFNLQNAWETGIKAGEGMSR